MGDDGKYHVSSEGTFVFQREHGAPLTLTYVKYVSGLKKNLVSVTIVELCNGYVFTLNSITFFLFSYLFHILIC